MNPADAPTELYAVLITLDGDHLLLPNAAVAEVLGQEQLDPAAEGAPAWLAGHVMVGGRRVPAIRFEALNHPAPRSSSGRGRLILVNLIEGRLASGQLALLAQSYPQLLQLNPAALTDLPLRAEDRSDLVAARVRLASTEAIIPDLPGLEGELLLRLG